MRFCAMAVAVITRSGNRGNSEQQNVRWDFGRQSRAPTATKLGVILEKVKQMVSYGARKNWENQKKLILLFICIPQNPGLLVL